MRWSKLSAKSNGRKIETDEQYTKARDWLVKTAIQLEDPLNDMSPEDKTKAQAIYDRTSSLVQSYRRGELGQQFPGLRKIYAELGWVYDEREQESPQSEPMSSKTEPEPAPEQPPPQPEPEPPKPTVNISAWLDDD